MHTHTATVDDGPVGRIAQHHLQGTQDHDDAMMTQLCTLAALSLYVSLHCSRLVCQACLSCIFCH
jgi:hypothetical protein